MTDNQTLAQEDKWKTSLLLSIYCIWVSSRTSQKINFTFRGKLFYCWKTFVSHRWRVFISISLQVPSVASIPWGVCSSPALWGGTKSSGVLCLHKMLICSSNLPELHNHLTEIKGNYPAGCRTKHFYATINTHQFAGVWLQMNGHF